MRSTGDDLLEEIVAGRRGRRVPIKDVWAAFQRVSPHLSGSVRARDELSDLLRELSNVGALALPRRRSGFDNVQRPALPKWVLLPAPAPAPRALEKASRFAWHPSLAFVPKLDRLSDEELEELLAIQAFLRDHTEPVMVTLRERSFELFGDEKRLERLAKGRLFGPGRLDFSLLRCAEVRTPILYRDVGEGSAALIVENKDTFHSACEAVRRLGSQAPIRWVVFGSGRAVVTTLGSVSDWTTRPDRAWYFGDIDVAGLEIAAQVVRVAKELEPPLIIHCPDLLYRVLVERASKRAARTSGTCASAKRATDLAAWLPPDIRPAVSELLMRGGSWPQEAVSGPSLETALRDLKATGKPG